MTRTIHREFDSLRIEGGIFPGEFLNSVRELKLKGQSSTDYNLHRTLKLRDEISRYWRIAKAEWEAFNEARQRQDIDRSVLAVERFLVPLLQQVFGFVDLEASEQPRYLGERLFPLTHQASFALHQQADIGFALTSAGTSVHSNQVRRIAHVPLVLTGPDFSLDKSHLVFGDEQRRRSPQGLLQEFLNASGDVLWGIASNGLLLRILRDNPSMTRPAFLEVDLVRMFEDDLYSDFVALWLTLHASRFTTQDGKVSQCWLERWREQAVAEGERARSDLRAGVETALRALGTGFVAHPNNHSLRDSLSGDELSPDAFFQQMLRLVYRLLFLLTAEDRNILHSPEANTVDIDLYVRGYSLSLLRDRARKRRFYDENTDLWQALTSTFDALRTGQPLLGLPALGGLFASEQCLTLENACISNKALLAAIRAVTWVQRKTGNTRINYRDMDTEELGSVYESLLELIPRINPTTSPWQFAFIGDEESESNLGNARKTSGSYYTPDSLVQELIQSALMPVIDQRLKANTARPRDALLSIKVCDPACGSGHFLLAAARRLAARLAELDAQGDAYTEHQYRHALREVVLHCIHGVDLNPMAIELCKTALWLEALEPGKPLGFLDAHIQCGNALIGVLDPAVLEDGIPDSAYKPLTGDSKAITSEAKKRNKQAVKKLAVRLRMGENLVDSWESLPEDTVGQVAAKRIAWLAAQDSEGEQHARLLEDLYTAAFFVPKDAEHENRIPTNQELIAAHQGHLPEDVRELVQGIAGRQRFFHWHLAFPQVFKREHAGFDVVLGNPPWERIKLQEKEFFAARHPAIANARNAVERQRMIEALAEGMQWERELEEEFYAERRGAEASSLFARSGRYPLTAVGDVNLYALFAEHMKGMIHQAGRVGVILPIGIATDDTTKLFFADIVRSNFLVQLIGCHEIRRWFPGTDDRNQFCLLTMGAADSARLSFGASSPDDFTNASSLFYLSAEEFALLNPNTNTCPLFRSQADAELTKSLYRRAPILIRDARDKQPEHNPWGIRFQAMFHMSSDSGLFRSYDVLMQQGGVLKGNTITLHSTRYLPLYEAKLMHQYDHRWATYERDGVTSRDMTDAEKWQPDCMPLPRYWLDEWETVIRTSQAPELIVKAYIKNDPSLFKWLGFWALGGLMEHYPERTPSIQAQLCLGQAEDDLFSTLPANTARQLQDESPLNPEETERLTAAWLVNSQELDDCGRELLRARCPGYLLGWRNICRSTDERTVIAGLLPMAPVGHSMPLMYLQSSPSYTAVFLGMFTCLVFDYLARQKMGGTNLTYGYLKQFPALSPDTFSEADLAYIIPRVLELVYTAQDLRPFAEDLGYHGEPFPWDPERRHKLKCELDAYYAHLYGLTYEELLYILDPSNVMPADYPSVTFPTLKRKEIVEYGEYRTQRLVLEEFDALARERTQATTYEKFCSRPTGHGYPGGRMAAQVYSGLIVTALRQFPALSLEMLSDLLALVCNPRQRGTFLRGEEVIPLPFKLPDYSDDYNLDAALDFLRNTQAIRRSVDKTWQLTGYPLPDSIKFSSEMPVLLAQACRVLELISSEEPSLESEVVKKKGKNIRRIY